MRIRIAVVIFALQSFISLAQNQGISNLWIMGYDCCNPPFSGMNLDFNSGSLIITPVQRYMNFDETNGEICDAQGNLLFYSNGIYIANSLDDTMQNGSGLNPSDFTTAHTHYGLTIPQANLIIPFPNDSTKYYLFHGTSDDRFNTYAALFLYYSIIDITLNNGLGAVVQKNTILLNDSLVDGRITACRHANGRDWWIFNQGYMNGKMYEYLVTPLGIQGPWIKNIITHRDVYFGQAVFSPQGNKFAYYEPYGDLDIWDFDRCSGDFTNQVHIDMNDSAFGGGAAFSASGRFLYLSSMYYIYQFDMSASNIDSSKITIGVFDGTNVGGIESNFYLSALAPDGKIYTSCGNAAQVLHVINYPDSAGLACDFCQHCITLPGYDAFTIPNHPNYFLGAEGGTLCDSLPTGITTIRKPVDEFSLFPNPSRNDMYLTLGSDEIQSVRVFNALGQDVSLENDIIKGEYLHWNVSTFESGIYFLEITTKDALINRRFVRE